MPAAVPRIVGGDPGPGPLPLPPGPVSVTAGDGDGDGVEVAGAGGVVSVMVTVTQYTPARRPAVSQSNCSDVSGKISGSLVWNGPFTCHANT
jgi:hypothetical protein